MRHILLTTALSASLVGGALAQQAEQPAEEGEPTEGTVTTIETEPAEAKPESESEDAQKPVEPEVQTLEAETVDEDEAVTNEAETTAAPAEVIVREQASGELRLDWITDTIVRSPDGEAIGDVDDLILDQETGQLTAAILGVGGFLGIGEKKIAVNWSELQINYDANEITMNLTRAEADASPEYVFRPQEAPPQPEPAMNTGTDTLGTAPAAPPPASD